jgi:heptosyltransferase-2
VVLDAQKMEVLMNKFLVIQTAFIGDAILTLPMIQKLKELNPGCLIDVISIPETAVIFNHSPAVNEVHIFDKRGKHKTASQVYRFAKFIKQRGYARIYAPHRSLRTSLLVMLSGVSETYGFNINSMSHVYKHITDYKADGHEVERNLRLIKFPVTDDNWRILPEINIPSETENKIKGFFDEFGPQNNFAAVAPGSVWATKIYPAKYIKEVIEFLKTRYDQVFLIGGEKDRYICEKLAEEISGNVKSIAGNHSLIETISFLKRIKILISNDSAPAHLAMCADIPVLMLYCSTVPDFGFYPYNKRSYFLSFNDLFCKPCGIHGFKKCPLNNFACGYSLKPEIVITKIKEMINV